MIKRAKLPSYLHRYGPKKFYFYQLCLGLLIKEVFRLSYRRAARFLNEFYGICIHWTTLQKCRARLPLHIWQHLLSCTVDADVKVVAIDGTSLQRSNPSAHYLKSIDKTYKISIPVYINAAVDVLKRKFIAARHHTNRSSEVDDVYYFFKRTKQDIGLVVMDKAYDSEKLHRILREQGTYSIVPVKKNWARGQYRKQLKECIEYALYWQRNIIECLVSALKRLFRNNLRCLVARTQRAEIHMRLIAYNLGAVIIEIFY